MASTVAMSITTPIKAVGSGGIDDMINGSPLPTPPQATHDLRRYGNGAARVSLQNIRGGNVDQYNRSSSPSSRAALSLASSSRDAMKISDLNHSPSTSTSVSMNHNHKRHALGSQMGILTASLHQASSRVLNSADLAAKPSRPGALVSSSQRSASYENSAAARSQYEDTYLKMNSRSSQSSLAMSAAASSRYHESNKENVGDLPRSTSGVYRRSSTARRPSSRRSPSPTATATVIAESMEQGPSQRRASEESEKELQSRIDAYTKTSDEGGNTLTRRRDPQESERYSPRLQEYKEESVVPGMSHYVTPGLNSAARALRAGQAPPKHPVAPWSVGRPMKRLNQLDAPLKPPQRVIAIDEHNEDLEEEPERNEADHHRDHVESLESSKHSQWQSPSEARRSEQSSLRGGRKSDSEGSNKSPPASVPLGADDDEEEDDYIHDLHRSASRSEAYSLSVRKVASAVPTRESETEPEARRNAMRDILSAKVPLAVNKRAIEGGPSIPVAFITEASSSLQLDPRGEFMAQVRQEAVRQRGKEHLDKLNGKPSKDLETKFNGYKFKKIRKAGEGGFSTVWQVRGPFAAPDPVNPGNYIDIPEDEQAYFAMKQVTLKKMEKISREEVLEECNLLQTLAGKRNNEDFILRFFGWKSSTGSLKILLELGEHDFNQILREGRLSRQQIRQYWKQMLEAVHFTHEEGNIVHTDLKPANFLMANGRLKLIDFGIAQKIPVGTIHIKRDAMIGTPNYMAPETVKAVKEARREGRDARVYKAGKASDVWALGCIFYQMVYNKPPFEAFHGDEKLKEILNPNHTIEYAKSRPAPYRRQEVDDDEEEEERREQVEMEEVDEDMIEVMKATFIYDPSERVTIPRLLHHRFLTSRMIPDDDETVIISRGKLKEMLRKIYAFTHSGALRDDNLMDKGDDLFDNIRDQQHLIS